MSTTWEDIFRPELVPEWLMAFESAPLQAINSLLCRRFYFGSLNAADPEELLVDWVLLAGDNGFVGQLDEALATWVETNWGIFLPEISAARLADAWSRLANIVTYVEELPLASMALRNRFDDREDFLGPLSVGPSRDPLGRYLMAISEHQEDRTLAPFWWSLCDLPDGAPFYHAPYAIAGLLGLPPLDQSQSGGFREHVAWGIVRLAEALHRRTERQEVQPSRARDEWLWTTSWAMARLPFPRWSEIFEEAIRGGLSKDCQDWLRLVAPNLARKVGGHSVRHRNRENFNVESWRERGKLIARALRTDHPSALEAASELLLEEERYALMRGDSRNLVLSINNFARSIWDRDPDLALRWLEMARLWEPWNAHTWSQLVQAFLKAGKMDSALFQAWEAVERFPEDVVVWNTLAGLLRKTGRLIESKAVYLQTVNDFPGEIYSRNGLAGVLSELGRLDEAEAIYRQVITDVETDPVARNGLAETLWRQGRFGESEEIYREAIARFPTTYALNSLAMRLSEVGRLDEAAELYRESMKSFMGDPVAPVGLAAVLRRLGENHLEEALALIEGVLNRGKNRVAALAEKGRILEAMERFPDAAEAFESSRRAQGNNHVSERAEKGGILAATEDLPEIPRSFGSVQSRDSSDSTESNNALSRAGGLVRWLSRSQMVALTSEARLLRRWASRGGDPAEDKSPVALRHQAMNLIEQVLHARPEDARALTERGLLLLDGGQLQEARVVLSGALERLPGTPALLAAVARLEREQARAESFRLTKETVSEVFEAADRLQALGSEFEPLIHLQKGRAVLVCQDGDLRIHLAAQEFDKLHKWIRPWLGPTSDTFEAWWSNRLNEQVFLPLPPSSKVMPEDVYELSIRLNDHAAEIDALDEVFGLRKSPRALSVA